MSKKRCGICKGALDREGDPGSRDCGGDCLRCMVEAGDVDAVSALAEATRAALGAVIDAWELLRGGQYHSATDVERWLNKSMAPKINAARALLGRKKPS